MKQFVAMKAFVEHEGKVLILRESATHKSNTGAGSYDVPGGRVDAGENPMEALRREVKEETGLEVEIGQLFSMLEWQRPIYGEDCQIFGLYFRCTTTDTAVQLSKEHDQFEWIDPKDHESYTTIGDMHKVFEDYLNR